MTTRPVNVPDNLSDERLQYRSQSSMERSAEAARSCIAWLKEELDKATALIDAAKLVPQEQLECIGDAFTAARSHLGAIAEPAPEKEDKDTHQIEAQRIADELLEELIEKYDLNPELAAKHGTENFFYRGTRTVEHFREIEFELSSTAVDRVRECIEADEYEDESFETLLRTKLDEDLGDNIVAGISLDDCSDCSWDSEVE